MHVPWGWIKQRPHFIAEQLSSIYKVDVFVPFVYKRRELTSNETHIKFFNIFKLPFGRFKFIRKIDETIVKLLFLYKYNISKYEYVWLTDLRLYPYIKGILGANQKLIYDCMDDILEFEILRNQFEELESIERELFLNSNFIFFSSTELKNRKTNKYPIKNYEVVFNAVDSKFIDNSLLTKYDGYFNKYKINNYKILTYIGTISDWFDFEIIEKSLLDFENIVYFIVGPIETHIKIFEHERVIYIGSVEHKFIKSIIIQSDFMIMPFKINKLIEAVDPVKMYEYIALNSNVISVKYDELEKFKEFINLYETYDEFKKYISVDTVIKKNEVNNAFFDKNNWKSRVMQIVDKI